MKNDPKEIPYGPGHPSYVAPLPGDLVDLLRGREFDCLSTKEATDKCHSPKRK